MKTFITFCLLLVASVLGLSAAIPNAPLATTPGGLIVSPTNFIAANAISFSVDTMADLVATPVRSNTVCLVRGYNAIGDGGGGPFMGDVNNSAGTNTGTVIKPTGAGLTERWMRLVSGPLTPQMFGAPTPDGNLTVDHTPYVQIALNVCTPAQQLYIPPYTVWKYGNLTNHPSDVQIWDDSGYDWAYTNFAANTKVIYVTDSPGLKNANEFNIMSQYHPSLVIDALTNSIGNPGWASIILRHNGESKWLMGNTYYLGDTLYRIVNCDFLSWPPRGMEISGSSNAWFGFNSVPNSGIAYTFNSYYPGDAMTRFSSSAETNSVVFQTFAGTNELHRLYSYYNKYLLFSIRPDNLPPTVRITAPTNGITFAAPSNVPLTANAGDVDGSVGSVVWYRDATPIWTNTVAPYTNTDLAVAAGAYVYSAVATDDKGGISTNQAVVTIAAAPPANYQPTVYFTVPTNGLTAVWQTDITLTATAADSDGSITNVAFYRDGIIVGNDTAAPYTVTDLDLSRGDYLYTVIASDDLGATITNSAVVHVVVQANWTAYPSGTLSCPDLVEAPRIWGTGRSGSNFWAAGRRVGIGTIDPQVEGLEVRRDATNSALEVLYLSNGADYGTNCGTAGTRVIYARGSGAYNKMAFTEGGNVVADSSASGYLSLGVRDASVLTEKARIDPTNFTMYATLITPRLRVGTKAIFSNGDDQPVGIGTTTPSGDLHVKSTNASPAVLIDGPADGSPYLALEQDGVSKAYFQYRDASDSAKVGASDLYLGDAVEIIGTQLYVNGQTVNWKTNEVVTGISYDGSGHITAVTTNTIIYLGR